MEEREQWRDITGYTGLYQVSSWGRVKSLERTVRIGRGYRTAPERILKSRKNRCGYLYVNLHKNGIVKTYTVHRMVACAFCENPQGYSEVNHIDENKENNCASNLEFCSRHYNCNFGDRNERIAEKLTNHPKKSKPIFGVDKITGLIVEFPSSHEASRALGINQSNIIQCCIGKRKSTGGFYWRYIENNEEDC